jgi:predicted MFS family arabinose efflux permease
MGRARESLREPVGALVEVFRNPNLRRIQLAWAGSIVGQFAFSVALAVYSYQQGGATVVGLVIVARMVPAAIVAPLAAIVADRRRREQVMLACDLVRALALAAAGGIVLADGPPPAVYVLGAVVTIVATVFHPAQAALLPSLAVSAEELTAANVSSSSIESVGSFAGPAIGGLVLAGSGVGAAFFVAAATLLWSAAFVARLRPPRSPEHDAARADRESTDLRREALAGFRTILAEPKLRTIVGLYGAQTLVAGAAGVLIVVIALRLLDLGEGAVGYLNAAIGIGGLVGAGVALVLVGRRKLAGDFGVGLVLWGAAFVAIGLWPKPVVALAALGGLGLGNTLVDVSALTLLQRSAPDEVLARVFGVVQALSVAAMGLGALVAPLLLAGLGVRPTLLVAGLFLPLVAAISWRRLRAIDREAEIPARELALLRSIPIFAPLPPQTLEHLAHALSVVHVPRGSDVVRAGDPGHSFFILDSGGAELHVDGDTRAIEPGAYFGEIALLRNLPRTATVRAVSDLVLYALDRDEFIGAVTGHSASSDAADAVIGDRLGSLAAGAVPI